MTQRLRAMPMLHRECCMYVPIFAKLSTCEVLDLNHVCGHLMLLDIGCAHSSSEHSFANLCLMRAILLSEMLLSRDTDGCLRLLIEVDATHTCLLDLIKVLQLKFVVQGRSSYFILAFWAFMLEILVLNRHGYVTLSVQMQVVLLFLADDKRLNQTINFNVETTCLKTDHINV